MDDTDSLITGIYAAAAEELSWSDAMLALQRATGAVSSSLINAPAPLGRMEALHATPFDGATVQAYLDHFHRIDPWVEHLRPGLAAGIGPQIIRSDHELRQEEYRATEYYNDFGRRIGLEWIVVGIGRIGQGYFNIGLHRPGGAKPFAAEDLQPLRAALPHVQRALELRARLGAAASGLPLRMLDAVPEAAMVVDATLAIHHANTAALRLSGPASGLSLARDGSRPGAPLHLRLPGTEETARLTALVQSVARLRQAGGAMRLAAVAERRRHAIAILVSPLPGALHPAGRPADSGPVQGLALLLLRPLDRPGPPAPLLQTLFGLTAAEAEVASGLAGGIRAEQLAERRRVSLPTIRAQVRAVLEKTGTVNLRELEALLASLPLPGPAENEH
ncbi:hypothetical protein J8J14_15050 [Roseomonas sp. SSH11]|uniref:HTH luxR-type domain-containing protein n=1 Tax=Pararoseomonas baculiformis TaxID=2820812 RepID=A0ABS4AGF2_9PROT|nr:hypothetical protein [Pararoseomonas baculiformis]MBP0446090.1 hypothetical protein [Pararoseomonas baculiformis]